MTNEIQSEAPSDTVTHGKEDPFTAFGNPAPDWRVWFGAIFSVVWLIMLFMYISGTVGWGNIRHAPIATMGNFLEGAFAPLAFLWLVIGYFLQKKELVQNTNAIKMQYVEIQKSAAQAEIQTHAIKATELHARKESFLRIADSVKQQLGTRMGYLFLSSQGSSGSGMVSSERIGDLWSSMNQNDPEVFSRSMMQVSMTHGESYAYKLFFGTPIRTKHTEYFIFNFKRMIRAAEECDDDGMIRDSLLGSAHGFIYERMIRYKSTPPPGFAYDEYGFDPDTFDAPNSKEHS